MSNQWSRTLATMTIALVAGVGLTACSAGATITEDKGSETKPDAGVASSATMTIDDFAQRIQDAQIEAGTASFTQSTTVSGETLDGAGQMSVSRDGAVVDMVMTVALGTGDMEVRLVDGVMYMNMGELTQNKFVAFEGADNPLGQMLDTSQIDVGSQMENLKDAVTDFTATDGTERIDGVETTRYDLTVDVAKLLAAQGVTDEAVIQAAGDSASYSLFVGPDDLPRRISVDLGGAPTTMDYSKWGEPVNIVAPTADELTEMPGL